ncbi:acyl carrier protein [Leptolyngbyaceae cyanobacterium CCMR0082]|uniref:Acyl carrier protein n=2 Tax=Adonisia turfae TaxID=2950184 RepID=A0A6M0SAK0_9CYAN|nr:phosphopantetheine-binding protein [Adonisia turfae]MDV3347341.1 phosphopantetheine-binding protein [Leptothoe sp. LEGE 181152]NEZ55862.1 acyl carrier protein [Adonisia turfae CCMR0081]NEZ65326.1 acyl carrier protein [Adonisia turfae CCMR0082]
MNALQPMNVLMDILYELGIPTDELNPDSFLYKDLQLDSTEIVEVAVVLKQKFGVRIKLEGRRDKTLSEVCDLINSSISKDSENAS